MFAHDNRLDFWIVNEMKYPLFAPLALDLLSALHLKHIRGTCVLSLWRADSWQEKQANERP